MKKLRVVLLMFLLSIPLVACNSNSDTPKTTSTVSADTKDLSSYPEGVQNGIVSPAFYDEVMKFNNSEFANTSINILSALKEYNQDSQYFNDENNISTLLDLAQNGKRNLNKLEFNPITDADKELYDSISEYISDRIITYNYLIEFCSKKDYDYMTIYRNEYKTIQTKQDYFFDLAEEFKINE